jgi:hypothetical protein
MATSVTQPQPGDVQRDAARQPQKVVLPGQTPEGQHILSVLVKRTYDVRPGAMCQRAAADGKLNAGDVYYDDPMNSSVKYESDFVPFKLGTDVVVNATAYAPSGRPTPSFVVSVEVNARKKDILVIGDRVCLFRDGDPPSFTDPEPLTSLEVRYERAYGGMDIYSDPKLPCPYGRNPLGRGFVIANIKRAVDNLELPNFEDADDRLTPERLCLGHFMFWERQPMPQGFGWFPKHWRPRGERAGVMPADRAVERELRRAYALVVPPDQREMYAKTSLPDMDFRFFNGASPGLALPFLSGGEWVRLTNLTPDGALHFQLPAADRPKIGLDIGQGVQEPAVVLHTVMVRAEDGQVDLVWRAAVPYPGPDWLPQMRKMEVSV